MYQIFQRIGMILLNLLKYLYPKLHQKNFLRHDNNRYFLVIDKFNKGSWLDYYYSEYIKIREYKDTDCPVILLFPHSGRQYFKDFLKSLKVSEEELRVSEDAYLDYLFSECINQEINSLYANFPRVFVDVNRDPLELDNRDFKNYPNDVTFKDSRLVRSGIGLIHTRSVNGKLFYKEKSKLFWIFVGFSWTAGAKKQYTSCIKV